MDAQSQRAGLLVATETTDADDPGQRSVSLGHALALGVGVAPGVVGCSVTAMVGAGFVTVAGSTSTAWALDAAQYHAGRGPCVTAARAGRVAGFDVDGDGDRYPGFAAAALARGVHSVLSVPPPGPRRGLGVNLYFTAPHAFDADHTQEAAAVLARRVADILDPPDTSPGAAAQPP